MAANGDGPPSKKMRLDPREPQSSNPGTPVDDLDDLYGTPPLADTPLRTADLPKADITEAMEPTDPTHDAPPSVIPGLGLLSQGRQNTALSDGTTEHNTDTGNISQANGEATLGNTYGNKDTDSAGLGQMLPPTMEAVQTIKRELSVDDDRNGLMTEDIQPSIEVDLPAVVPGLNGTMADGQDLEQNGEAEWEMDSSPVSSSGSDSSSESEEGEDEEEDADDYKLLEPEERARILMEGDGGSDDEGDPNAAGNAQAGTQVKTKNEVVDIRVEKPNVTITADMGIQELGTVESVVGNAVVIKANISGEYRVLEFGSVLCLQDRSVIGAVSETLGRVQQPYYSVLFNSAAEITQMGLFVGARIFYAEKHATFVFTQALKAFKGSDASNIHDEEVGEEEVEFSDDEAEAAHRRRLKHERQAKRGGRTGPNPPRPGSAVPAATAAGLSYDDPPGVEADHGEPYTRLARPANYQELLGRGNAMEEALSSNGAPRGHQAARGIDRGRGRGSRGAGRGFRGRGGPAGRSRPTYESHRDNQPGQSGPMNPPASSSSSYPSTPGYGQAQAHGHMPPTNLAYLQPSPASLPTAMPGFQQPGPASLPTAVSGFQQPGPASLQTGVLGFHQPGPASLPTAPTGFQQPYPFTPYGWVQPPPPLDFPSMLMQQPTTPLSASFLASPGGSLPAGAHVNPAFFGKRQSTPMHGQRSPPATQMAFNGTGGLHTPADPDAAYRAAQEKLDIIKGLSRHGSGSP